jgi:hypothetical protein
MHGPLRTMRLLSSSTSGNDMCDSYAVKSSSSCPGIWAVQIISVRDYFSFTGLHVSQAVSTRILFHILLFVSFDTNGIIKI